MLDSPHRLVFVAGLIASEVIRFPHRMRNKQERRRSGALESHVSAQEIVLSGLGFLGLTVLPLLSALTGWPRRASYSLPPALEAASGAVGAGATAAGLWLLYGSHADLDGNWSPTLELTREHTLVTSGAYARIRHPIYAAVWLLALGQALLLRNWVAGPAGLASFLAVYTLRVPEEERMMLERFGDEYRAYAARTGRIVPRTVGR